MREKEPPAEILQDLPFHQRQWLVQRIAWLVVLVVLALALLGLFGDGPLSHVQAGSRDLQLEYDRFIRRNNPVEMRIDAQAAANHEVRVAFSRDYLHAFHVDSMLPRPERFETSDEEVIIVFRVTPPITSARITIDQTPLHAGALQGTLRAAGQEIKIHQFVFP